MCSHETHSHTFWNNRDGNKQTEMLPLRTHDTTHFTTNRKNTINNGIVGAVLPCSYLFICTFFLQCAMLTGSGWGETKLGAAYIYLFICLFIYLFVADIAHSVLLSFIRFFLLLLLSIHPWLFLKLKRNDSTVRENIKCKYFITLHISWLCG